MNKVQDPNYRRQQAALLHERAARLAFHGQRRMIVTEDEYVVLSMEGLLDFIVDTTNVVPTAWGLLIEKERAHGG